MKENRMQNTNTLSMLENDRRSDSNSLNAYRMCVQCVMDTTVADITFNGDGICCYCQKASERLKREYYVGDEYRGKLDKFIAQVKREGRRKTYDCIIGVSGGVDSSYVAYLVKRVFGLRPLAVHFDNGWNSELAVQNIEHLLKKLDIDLYTYVVDWEEFRDLQLAFLKASVPNSEIPTDHAIFALLYHIAAKNNVRYILHGGNIATESIMPAVWMHDAKDHRFLKAIHKRFGTRPLKTFQQINYARLAWYVLVRRIRYVGVLNYVDYNKEEAMRLLENDLGWRRYEAKHFESIYTRFFQGYLLPQKFGIDKRKPHLSSMIMSGQITREDAIELLKMPIYNPNVIAEDTRYFCQKFGMSQDEFDAMISSPVKRSDDYPNSKWLIRMFIPMVKLLRNLAAGRLSRTK